MEEALTVFIEGLEFYAYHGVPPEERVIGHRYVVDLRLGVSDGATQTDRVEDSADYGAIAIRITELGRSTSFQTVERLAQVIADDLLQAYPVIAWLQIRLAKRLPPAPVIAAATGVELYRKRSETPVA